MTSKAIARIVPIKCEEFDPREPFYVVTVNDFGEGLKGKLMDGAPYSLPKRHWKVEMLPVEWNGEGLPPVGAKCEISWLGSNWCTAEILFVGESNVVLVLPSNREVSYLVSEVQFRPIRSARDKAVSDLMNYNVMGDNILPESIARAVYDAIVVGAITGVKLDN